MNHARWRSSPAPTAPSTASSGTSTAGEADGRVAVRVGVGERRVVDDLDAGRAGLDEEQRREPLAVLDHVRDHDVDGRDVARRHEPLLAVDAEAARRCARAVVAIPDGSEPGVLLGHRVGVLRLAAQAGPQPAVDLLGRAVGEHVVGRRDVPREAVRRAAELLLDERPLDVAPALAAVLDRVQAAVQARGERRRGGSRRPRPAGSTPPARSAISSRGISTSSTKRRARSWSSAWAGVSVPRPGSRSASRRPSHGFERLARVLARPAAAGQPEQQAGLVAHDVAHDLRGVRDLGVALRRPRGELRRLAQPREVRRLAAAQDERLGALRLAGGVGGERPPSAAAAARRSPPGARAPARGEREPCPRRSPHTHGAVDATMP